MRGYVHSNCKYLRIIEMHDYHESTTVLTMDDNHEFKGENCWTGLIPNEVTSSDACKEFSSWQSLP